MEKHTYLPPLPQPNQASPPAPKSSSTKRRLLLALALFAPLALLHLLPSSSSSSSYRPSSFFNAHHRGYRHPSQLGDDACYQPEPLEPSAKALTALEATYASEEFLLRAAEWLGGAVRVETEIYDLYGSVEEDPVWKKFEKFHDYIEKAFPLVHKSMSVTKVNTYGIVFAWPGSDTSLKPFLLAGHQDTVPVEKTTIDAWKEPPFSGKFDGEFVWGRGSCDDKSGTIGILSAFESLLEAGFSPRRTVLFASGFDEEGSGPRGAGMIGPYLEKTYGKNGIAMIVDEGGGYAEQFGVAMASPGTGEKGQINLEIVVNTLGGHSSIPPDHTSIGILSLLIAEVERNPHSPLLTRENPFYEQLVCSAKYGTTVEPNTKKLIEKSRTCDKKLKELGDFLGQDRISRTMVATTQAVDLIEGGVKVNALPEKAVAVVNNRINVASSYQEVQARLVNLLLPLATDLNFQLDGFGTFHSSNTSSPAAGIVTLQNWSVRAPLNPAPITPTGKNIAPWELLAGTIKSSHAARKSVEKDEPVIVVTPSIMTGNTDTKHYWNLTDHIYRYAHISGKDMYTASGVHSVNEALRATAFVDAIRFFTRLVLNADEANL